MDDIILNNKSFEIDESFLFDKMPKKKLAIVTCMDSRITKLIKPALGLKDGDAKIIRNAGGVIKDEYSDVIRSLVVAINYLGVNKIMIIAHDDCGMLNIDEKVIESNVFFDEKDVKKYLGGFKNASESVQKSLSILKNHKLIGSDLEIRGFVMNPLTGKIKEVEEGEKLC